MLSYWKKFLTYHKKNVVLYVLVLGTIYLFYYFKLPTPLSLMLKPLGIPYWSDGLTRASVRLLFLDFEGAYHHNPLIFPIILYCFCYFFYAPIYQSKKGKQRSIKES